MANENETVEQVCEAFGEQCEGVHVNSCGYIEDMTQTDACNFINDILAAHKRELAAKDAVRFTVAANYASVIAAKDRIIDAKDAEIARLTNIINTECNKCGDCAKFGSDCSAGDVDGNEDCRACNKFISKEIAKRNEIIKELADALEMEIVCYEDCASRKVCATAKRCDSREYRALVAKAREVIK